MLERNYTLTSNPFVFGLFGCSEEETAICCGTKAFHVATVDREGRSHYGRYWREGNTNEPINVEVHREDVRPLTAFGKSSYWLGRVVLGVAAFPFALCDGLLQIAQRSFKAIEDCYQRSEKHEKKSASLSNSIMILRSYTTLPAYNSCLRSFRMIPDTIEVAPDFSGQRERRW